MEKWRQISSSAPLHPRDNLSVVLGWGASQGSELLPAESRAPVVCGAFLCFWLAHVQLNLPVTVCAGGVRASDPPGVRSAGGTLPMALCGLQLPAIGRAASQPAVLHGKDVPGGMQPEPC